MKPNPPPNLIKSCLLSGRMATGMTWNQQTKLDLTPVLSQTQLWEKQTPEEKEITLYQMIVFSYQKLAAKMPKDILAEMFVIQAILNQAPLKMRAEMIEILNKAKDFSNDIKSSPEKREALMAEVERLSSEIPD